MFATSGGDGPFLLLWHGAGVDATIWESVIPHLTSFRVVAQDLPGHGRSSIPRLSVGDAIADGDAVVTDLGLGEPILAGLSLGGWAALHYAATRPCRALVCLDGPTNLDYEAMGIRPNHPGFVPDPPDVPADFASLRSRHGRALRRRIARRCEVDGPLSLPAGGASDYGTA
jgi:pimeloyl-ACP methyl ester carboxylesterase